MNMSNKQTKFEKISEAIATIQNLDRLSNQNSPPKNNKKIKLPLKEKKKPKAPTPPASTLQGTLTLLLAPTLHKKKPEQERPPTGISGKDKKELIPPKTTR